MILEQLPQGERFPLAATMLRCGDAIWVAVESEHYQQLQTALLTKKASSRLLQRVRKSRQVHPEPATTATDGETRSDNSDIGTEAKLLAGKTETSTNDESPALLPGMVPTELPEGAHVEVRHAEIPGGQTPAGSAATTTST